MTLFRLDASHRTEGSVSRALADAVEQSWRSAHPSAAVVRRDLRTDPVRVEDWYGVLSGDGEAAARGTALADELVSADGFLLAVPLYNFGVAGPVKAWLDLVLTDPRFAPGQQPLAGRPAVLVTSRGGGYAEGTPRHGWDHSTPYLRRILSDVWGLELEVVEAELTLAESTPAMAGLLDLAKQSRADAEAAAVAHGRALGERLRTAA